MDNELKQIEESLLLKQKAYISSLQDKIHIIESENKLKDAEIAQTSGRLNEALKTIEERENAATTMKTAIDQKDLEKAALESSIKEIEAKLKMAEEGVSGKEKYWSERYNSLMAEMEEERKKSRSKLVELETQKEIILKERDEVRESYRIQVSNVEEFRLNQTKKESDLLTEIEKLKVDINAISLKEAENQKLTHELESVIKNLEAERVVLNLKIQDVSKLLDHEKAANQDLTEQYKQLANEIRRKKKVMAHKYSEKLAEMNKQREYLILTAVSDYKKESQIIEKEFNEANKKLKASDKLIEELKETSNRTIKALESKVLEKEQALQHAVKLMEKSKRDLGVYIEGLEGEKSAYLADITSLNEEVEKYYRDNKTLVRENRILLNKLLSLREFNGLKRIDNNARLEGLECDYESVKQNAKKPRSFSPTGKGYRNQDELTGAKSRPNFKKNFNQVSRFKNKENNTEKFFDSDFDGEQRISDEYKLAESKPMGVKTRRSKQAEQEHNYIEASDNEASPTILEALKKLHKDCREAKNAYESKKKEVDALSIVIVDLKESLVAASEGISAYKQEIAKLRSQLNLLGEKDNIIANLKAQSSDRDKAYKEIETGLIESNKAYQTIKEKNIQLQRELAVKQSEYMKIEEQLEKERENFIEKFTVQRNKIRKYETLIGEDVESFIGNNHVLLDRIEQLEHDKYNLNDRIAQISAENERLKNYYDKNQFAQVKKRKPEEKRVEDKKEVPLIVPSTKVRNYNMRDDDY